MKPRLFASIVLFVGSYLPLSLILLAQDFRFNMLKGRLCWPFGDENTGCELPFRNSEYSITIFLICLACFLITLIALQSVKSKTPINVREAKYIPAELMSYTLPYIVSFMSLDYQETGKFVGILIFLSWMFVIIHKSGQIILNPLIVVFGWKLYEIKYIYPGCDAEYFGRALSKDSLEPGSNYKKAEIEDAMIIRCNEQEGKV